MASGRNKTGSSGLRILWIPGKKKQHKGSYNPTNKGFRPAQGQEKKIESWSLGGSKGQNELLKAEIPGHSEMASGSVVNCLPQTIGIGTTATSCAPEDPQAAKPDGEGEAKDQQKNGVPMCTKFGPLKHIDEDENENEEEEQLNKEEGIEEGSNTSTLLLKDRWPSRVSGKPCNGRNFDDVADGIAKLNSVTSNQQNRKKRKKKNKDSGMNEKTVDCLYVGLMCCECSIQ